MLETQAPQASLARVDKLNMAAALHGFDKSLDRSAWSSLGWGAFSLLIGLFLLYRGRFGWINIGFGVLIILVGFYQMKVRVPGVIKISAASLALLGAWNLALVVLAAITKSKVAVNPLFAIIQLIGAWSTYKSYALYAALLASSDPAANAEFKMLLDQLKNSPPATTPDVVEFTSTKKLGNNILWRIRSMDGLLFFVGNEIVLGRKKSQTECLFISREKVRFEIVGEKMFSSRQKVAITVSDVSLQGTMSPEMAQKLQMLLV